MTCNLCDCVFVLLFLVLVFGLYAGRPGKGDRNSERCYTPITIFPANEESGIGLQCENEKGRDYD